MKMIKKALLGALVCATCGCYTSYAKGGEETQKKVYTGEIERSYVTATRVIETTGQVDNVDRLLKPGVHQASTVNVDYCKLTKHSSFTLDFGKEMHGGIEIVTGMWAGNKPIKVRVRLGESVSETRADIGTSDNATNDHAIRDWEIELPWCGKIEIGNSGFRFVRVDLIADVEELILKEVNAIAIERDIPYVGSFKCNDERLNQVWKVGARTVHLNMQEYLWDGIKRDRLVWVGDMHPEVMTILSVFGANSLVPQTLDFAKSITPVTEWMNGISSYSMWWLLLQHQWYTNTADKAYLLENKDYILALLDRLETKIDVQGAENIDGVRFLDWPTKADDQAVHAGLQSMMVMTFEAGIELAKLLEEDAKAVQYTTTLAKLQSYIPPIPKRKSPAALMALAGLADAKSINDDILVKGGVKDLSTFYGYYVLNAMAKADNYQGAIDFISEYWGAMLDLGATTFWEDFDIAWMDNAARIDEIVPEGKVDVHRKYGAYCYKGLRHSFCHGWASGPTAWLSQYVLGVEIVEPGAKTIRVTPHLGQLEWVEGVFPTVMGPVKVKHIKEENGDITTEIDAPKGMKVLK